MPADVLTDVAEEPGSAKPDPILVADNIVRRFGGLTAVDDVSLEIYRGEFFSLLGSSGCGKSTFLRTLNRMNDIIPICKVKGDITLDGGDIYDGSQDEVLLRARVGMVSTSGRGAADWSERREE